jgi:hypothetical protein
MTLYSSSAPHVASFSASQIASSSGDQGSPRRSHCLRNRPSASASSRVTRCSEPSRVRVRSCSHSSLNGLPAPLCVEMTERSPPQSPTAAAAFSSSGRLGWCAASSMQTDPPRPRKAAGLLVTAKTLCPLENRISWVSTSRLPSRSTRVP